MNNNDYILHSDGKFLEWVKFLFTYVEAHATEFGLDPRGFDDINALIATYEQAYEKADDPNRGKADVIAKNETRDTLKKAVRQYVREYLTNNHLITDKDRRHMALPVHDVKPTPVATDSPDADIDTSVIGRITIHFFEKGSRHKKGKPAGQHGAEVAWLISDTPPARWDELLHSNIDTNSPFTLSFEHDQRGKTVYFALRWENTRGEKGPWSEIVSAIIP